MGDEEKTEEATPKKRTDERKKGNIFQSKDVTTAVFIFVSFYTLQLLIPHMYRNLSQAMRYFFSLSGSLTHVSIYDAQTLLMKALLMGTIVAGPIIAICFLTNMVIPMVQTKLLFSPELIKFKLSKLNPLKGIKRMVSLRSLVEVVKSMLKIGIITWLIYLKLSDLFQELPDMLNISILGVCQTVGKYIMSLVFNIGIVFLAIAVLDYFYQRWDHEKKLKMSKHEIKQEYKQMEGDPMIRGKRKELQRRMAMQRMMQEVPSADVIIRNPTHFAVALRYAQGMGNAPVVVAKGQDELALRIVAIGEENHVAITENPGLARGIYHSSELGQEIRPEYYQAVAEVLAWVYSLNKKEMKPL